jgi:hypothetical protein
LVYQKRDDPKKDYEETETDQWPPAPHPEHRAAGCIIFVVFFHRTVSEIELKQLDFII